MAEEEEEEEFVEASEEDAEDTYGDKVVALVAEIGDLEYAGMRPNNRRSSKKATPPQKR